MGTLGKNEAETLGKKAIKLQMRRDGNLMMLTEDVDANNLDMDDSKIVWSLSASQDRQLPNCVVVRRAVPCSDESACDTLCYPCSGLECERKECFQWTCYWHDGGVDNANSIHDK